MKKAMAGSYLYTIIIVFMVIVFAFIMGTILYYKSFKTNKMILATIEKYEGYNSFSITEIDRNLKAIGYNVLADGSCPKKENTNALFPYSTNYKYCVYYFDNDDDGLAGNVYYTYGVLTYVTLDFPFVNLYIKMPIYTKSNRIFRFGA